MSVNTIYFDVYIYNYQTLPHVSEISGHLQVLYTSTYNVVLEFSYFLIDYLTEMDPFQLYFQLESYISISGI